MKMMGMSTRSPPISFCSSRPFKAGRDTSRIRQLGVAVRGRARNSSADANVSGCHPANLINSSSDSRTETSSSTTKTIGWCCGFGAVTVISIQRMNHSTYAKRGVKCLYQIGRLKWLEQTIHCAFCNQARSHCCIALGRDKHDRDGLLTGFKLSLQIWSAHTWHRHIEHQTIRIRD